MEDFFKVMSYTRVAPGLIKHSPFSRQIPSSPNAMDGGIIAWTFCPTFMFATTSLRPLMTAVDPRMNWMGAFFPSAWVASKIYY
jgi:hypothetical protein